MEAAAREAAAREAAEREAAEREAAAKEAREMATVLGVICAVLALAVIAVVIAIVRYTFLLLFHLDFSDLKPLIVNRYHQYHWSFFDSRPISNWLK